MKTARSLARMKSPTSARLKPAPSRSPVDRHDNGHLEVKEIQKPIVRFTQPIARCKRRAVATTFVHRLHVASSAEAATGSRQDQRFDLISSASFQDLECFVEISAHHHGQRVSRVRPVERQRGNVVLNIKCNLRERMSIRVSHRSGFLLMVSQYS
ncbi:hypothetical protein RCO31_19055 [Bradyrhizobium sp. LHD-71]|nr:hypothetical protein [Bradyrhizobium sp. LHD-71]MDQ8729823.1 hypothetical protein [Bradyrhizobium sp. LHD-71]